MRQFQMLFVLGATIALSVANVFTLSLGDIAQYSTSLATTPTLTGSRVLFTDAASPKGGLDVLLSEELRANVKKAFDSNCKSIDDQCIGSVKELLINPQTQLESRQVGQVAAAVAAVILLAAVLLPVLEKDRTQGIPVALHIPSAQLDLAVSVAATATIAVITASGTPFVTVTPRTPTASSVGADKPTETILSRPKDGHKPGDFAIHLSADLARRLSEMIDRSQQCPAGDSKPGMKVAQSNGVSMKALVDDTGAIKCAAEAIILNSFPGGPFSDLGSVTGEQPGWSSSDMIEVASSVSTFATSLVKSFGGNAAGATTLAFAAVYIAYVQIAGKQRLTTVNWIPGSELKGTLSALPTPTTMTGSPTMVITATSATGSSSMLECSASCAMVGPMRNCNTWCPTPTDDSYTRPTEFAVKTVAFEPWHVPKTQKLIKAPIGICPPPPNNATDFPLELFSNVYSKFCTEIGSATKSVVRAVDAKGNSPVLTSRLRRWLKRGSSGDDDKYKVYIFTLSRTIRGGSSPTCSTTCARAFEQLSLQDICKRGDDKKSIAATGFLDAGCASYAFSIDVPKPPEAKAKIECGSSKGHFSAPKYDNSGTPSVESAIKEWCTRNDQTYLNSGSDERYGRFDIAQLGVPKRSSFWPRINLAESDKKGVVVKEQCISAFTDGLKECDSNSDKTHGFTAIVGTAKYSLELSGLVTEGNPPWQGSDKLSFPPSEFQNRYNGAIDNGDPWGIVCDIPNTYSGHKLYPDNLDKAINYFCVNGGPLKRHTQFYDNGKGKSSHLAMGAEPLNLKDSKRPYFDNRACDGYDWKMGADDCRYAFRKILGQCNNKDDRFNAGEWKYRCVNYKMWLVNV
ncbi:hypothetical protein HBI70_178250 [Parastagonospora nodorum]|nr:hypothetical protein HBI10_172750 [Parastagonospora nodorum]KAH4016153.1 hypothetical protein HBI13_154010 [Parastagonospora nodorum]KAH5087141.1 hypothetical protein HBI73_150410 [Parastagonospora nodorum]KAH5186349.1 hypothetical protein HBH68_166720 [Parastagonospora nodorum]KAH5212744.1 hypothetical protein HBI62_192730 [Parastagonospora nodorum]